MVKSAVPCHSQSTIRDKRWPYEEYYFGDRDDEDRKNGEGEHHWTGAESLEWYIGPMVRDTMHGQGDYRWRYKDPDGAFVTYEGCFFANHMHGYGMMSYPEGRVFTGIFYKDVRWGPGLERMVSLQANVGLWRGTRLARLAWRPSGPPIAPNLASGPTGPSYLNPFRIILTKNTKIIGETNSAIELLKHFGADPVQATEKWTKLYPKYCTDMDSALCYKDLFDRKYYKGKIHTLEEATNVVTEIPSQGDTNVADGTEKDIGNEEAWSYYAWNNNPMMLHMMKHCYQHENQRARVKLDLERILSGQRRKFRTAAKHETDCRTLLMASYAGIIANVTQLINEEDVFPDVADSQGNTALMYAVCGDQVDAIHFLIEAGADVNAFNDSCCTPLGIALMRYTCVANDVRFSLMTQALLPPKPEKSDKTVSPNEDMTIEWYINREASDESLDENKAEKLNAISRKSRSSFKSITNRSDTGPARTPTPASVSQGRDYYSDEDIFSNEKKLFLRVRGEYCNKIASQFTAKNAANTTLYLFTPNDMLKVINAAEEEIKAAEKLLSGKQAGGKSAAAPKKIPSKAARTKSIIAVDTSKVSNTSYDIEKSEVLSKISLTILQLLSDGADPKLVKCPQPAILLAMKSGCLDLIRHMVSYGADVNEKFPELLDYTVLDMAISEPFTDDNLEIVRTLLEVGADARHRLKFEDPAWVNQGFEILPPEGPTLLHVVISRKTESEIEEQIRDNIINLLLKYNADPTAQFRGRSSIELAMLKKLELLEVLINNPATNLNAIINQQNHTILVKLFSRDFFKTLLGIYKLPTLTSLLLYGADPLIECFDGDTRYENLFEFAKKTLNDIAPVSERKISVQVEAKKTGKSKTKVPAKSKIDNPSEDAKKKDNSGKSTPEANEYREMLNMMKECTRLLHIRWLQAKLLNELVDVIIRFKHRHWTMIIKEHKNADKLGLWVSVARCFEIWDILRSAHKKKFTDEKILRKLLRIVLFYQKRLIATKKITANMTAVEKNIVETDVKLLMKEHNIGSDLTKDAGAWKRAYVKPELDYKVHKKYKVCFECGIRLAANKISCDFCGLVSFCNLDCMTTNFQKASGHPCNEKLMEKYLPPAEDEFQDVDQPKPDNNK